MRGSRYLAVLDEETHLSSDGFNITKGHIS